MQESFLDEGFILDKKIGVGQPKRIENAKILVANTPMDTDKIKIYGARVRVDSMAKVRRGAGEGKRRVWTGNATGLGGCTSGWWAPFLALLVEGFGPPGGPRMRLPSPSS